MLGNRTDWKGYSLETKGYRLAMPESIRERKAKIEERKANKMGWMDCTLDWTPLRKAIEVHSLDFADSDHMDSQIQR